MKFDGTDGTSAYRVGFGDDLMRLRLAVRMREWWRIRYIVRHMRRGARQRSHWGLWQSEAPGMHLNARRGLTARVAERRMRRDVDRVLASAGRALEGDRDE